MNAKCNTNIVFQEKKYNIESAVSFYQNLVRCDRIVTMIGELHNKTFKCNSQSQSTITISEYCTKAVKRNPRCRVILEYYKDTGDGNGETKSDNPMKMNSHGIKETFESIQKIGKEDQIIPLDYRPTFLTRAGQDDLYGTRWWDEKEKSKNIHMQIQKAFVDPFTKAADKFGIKHPNQYSPKVKNFMDSYFENMLNHFEKINQCLLTQEKNISAIRQQLFDGWKLVADYFIIKKILKEEPEIDEYILILGQAHLLNIQSVFNDKHFSSLITELVHPQKGRKGKCIQIKLFKTIRFNSEI
jgi:hypothetical protein